jgi:hypothetical protein
MKTRLLLVLSFAALLVALVFLFSATRGGSGAGRIVRIVWKPGVAYTYDLRWRTTQSSELLPGFANVPRADAALDLDAKLVVRVLGQRDGAQQLELSLADAKTAKLRLMGSEIVLPVGVGVVAEVSHDGLVRSVIAPPEASDAWKLFARGLAGMVLELPADDGEPTWTAEAAAPFGRARARYHADGGTITRARLDYTRLDGAGPMIGKPTERGEGRIELTAGRELRAVHDVDHVTASAKNGAPAFEGTSELTLALVSTRTDASPALSLAGYENVDDVLARVAEASERRAAEQRVGNMTADKLLSDLYTFSDGDVPDKKQWFWQATGFLQLHPELCEQLVAPFLSGKLDVNGQSLVLDLLAQSDSTGAQAAMRTILTSPNAHGAAAYPMFLQRMALVSAPDPASIAMMRAERERARAAGELDVVRAGAYTLGAMAGTLAAEGSSDEARAITRALAAELAATTAPAERAHLLVALGSTKDAEQLPAILAGTRDESSEVRAATARALGNATTPEARDAELQLAADADATVQLSALAALDAHELNAEALTKIDSIVHDKLDTRCDTVVLRLLASRIQDGRVAVEHVASTLHALRERAADNPALRQAVDALLRRKS